MCAVHPLFAGGSNALAACHHGECYRQLSQESVHGLECPVLCLHDSLTASQKDSACAVRIPITLYEPHPWLKFQHVCVVGSSTRNVHA